MTLSCRQLRLLLSSPIFLTPCLFAAKSIFPFCICVAFVFLPRICIFGWTVAGLAGRPIFVFALGAGGVLCCHWTHSHSQRAAFVLPNNRRVTKHKEHIYTYKSLQIFCIYTNINYTNIQILEVYGALRAPTSSWRPFGPLDFVLCALWALRPCDPCHSDWVVC